MEESDVFKIKDDDDDDDESSLKVIPKLKYKSKFLNLKTDADGKKWKLIKKASNDNKKFKSINMNPSSVRIL